MPTPTATTPSYNVRSYRRRDFQPWDSGSGINPGPDRPIELGYTSGTASRCHYLYRFPRAALFAWHDMCRNTALLAQIFVLDSELILLSISRAPVGCHEVFQGLQDSSLLSSGS
jgi:hypothetical protein